MHLPIQEPVPPGLARRLRALALEHALSGQRRVYEPTLHVAGPVNEPILFTVSSREQTDAALRCDVAAALLRRARGSAEHTPLLAWLTRKGDPATQDVDLAWLAAFTAAEAESPGGELRFVVVTRRSWSDPASGAHRVWQRLRVRRKAV